ncbi:MAG: ABC transporter ATP-binding protein [Leptolyngbyaceae cyanobacterium]
MGSILFERATLEFPGMSRPAVNQVTCEVQSGEFVVILGPSGCGKTTLLKLVNRLYEPTSGRISVDGQDIRLQSPTGLRRKIGYVIQQSGLFPHKTVAQNVAVVPKLLKWPQAKIRQRVESLLGLVKLPPAEYRDRYPAQLSGGQQQRVGIARALAGDPDYLLMDEPFGAIDAITRSALQTEVLRLQQQLQKTILFVSHDVDEALRLGDRIIVMNAGRIAQYDTPFNLLTQPADDFVYDLLGADDRVRQLGVLSIRSAMQPLSDGPLTPQRPTVETVDTLRQALSLMLKTGNSELVVRKGDEPVGLLTLNNILARSSEANG